MTTEKIDYRYTECGLDNVVISNLQVKVNTDGERVYCLSHINALHRAIVGGVLLKSSGLSPAEVRFLRTEIGQSQEQLADMLSVSRATINRWENDQTRIEANAEFVFRILVAEKLGIDISSKSAEDLTKSCIWKMDTKPIYIDGSDPENYHPIAA